MAINYTTAQTDLVKLGRKLQGKALKGFARRNETWNWLKTLDSYDIGASAREVTTIIDITGQPNGAFISEFGAEANAYTAPPQELTFTWAFLNHRFTFSRTAEHLGRKHAEDQIIVQAAFQTQKLTEAMVRRVGLGVYGLSTGILCETTTNATQSSGTYTLNDGFGQSDIDTASYLANMFEVGDWVALVRAGALVSNGIGQVTAKSTTNGTLDITWIGSCDSDAGDNIVLANAYPESQTATLAGATEYNKAPFGLIEFMTSTTVHNLSGSTYPRWNPAGTDSTGGYITGTRIKKAKTEIKNAGGGNMDTLILAQDVDRALFQQTFSAVQFDNPLGMEILGSAKAKGVKIINDDPLCPAGYAFAFDSKTAVKKWLVTEMPDENAKSLENSPATTVDKLQGLSGHVLSVDFLYNLVCTKRADMYSWSGLTGA